MERKNQKKGPGKRPRIGDDRAENQKNQKSAQMKVDWSVWDIIMPSLIQARKRENEAAINQTFKTERERLKANSMKYGKMDIVDAFADAYDFTPTASKEVRESANKMPTALAIGSVIDLNIRNINYNGVVFDSGNYKYNFVTRNNLAKYPKLCEFLPVKPVPARVLEIRPNMVLVDVLGAMADQYIIPRAAEPWIQNRIGAYQTVWVDNLKLVRGGFMGRAVIPNVTDWCGEPYEVDAFIPGSQIVLNTTDDFESFEGKSVHAFIMSYGPKPNGQGMSLVCSVKSLLRHMGNLQLKDIYNIWCDDGQEWDNFKSTPIEGVVTGVINSAKKCGVFVELPQYCITGIVPMAADKLTEYKPGDKVDINFIDFDEEMIYNSSVDQLQHAPAFEIVDGAIKRVNVKPIFKMA